MITHQPTAKPAFQLSYYRKTHHLLNININLMILLAKDMFMGQGYINDLYNPTVGSTVAIWLLQI